MEKPADIIETKLIQSPLDFLSEIFFESKDTRMNLFHFRDIGIIANFVEELRRGRQKYERIRARVTHLEHLLHIVIKHHPCSDLKGIFQCY